MFLPGSHGTGWSPDYSHAAILCRSRRVRSAAGSADNSLSMGPAAVCMASGTDRRRSVSCFRKGPLSIRVRQRVRPSPSDAFADLNRRALSTPDEKGASIPLFVDQKLNVFDAPIDCAFLVEVQRHVAEVSCAVTNSVTQMGWQFPGSCGSGTPIWSKHEDPY